MSSWCKEYWTGRTPALIEAHEAINAYARDIMLTAKEHFEADNFYEWTGRRGSRVPYYICVEEEEVFSMAGIWETWSSNGDKISSVAIITTKTKDTVSELQDRVLIIIDRKEEDRWMEAGDKKELESILNPFPDERTRCYEVSKTVDSPANDKPELVEPLGTDQSGLRGFT